MDLKFDIKNNLLLPMLIMVIIQSPRNIIGITSTSALSVYMDVYVWRCMYVFANVATPFKVEL